MATDLEKIMGTMRGRFERFERSVDEAIMILNEYPQESILEDINYIKDSVDRIRDEMMEMETLMDNAGDFYEDELDADDYDD